MHGKSFAPAFIFGIVAVLLVRSSSALDYQVHVGYVIPSNRTAQDDGAANLQSYIPTMQNWYGDQMQRYGFGYKTFNCETLADGVTPSVHTVGTSMTDADLRSDIWGQTLTAASNAGLSLWSPGQVWLLVPEAHLQQPDGSIIGGTALGASWGSGSDPGVAMVGSDMLPRCNPSWLTNTQAYAGQTISQFGPYPLVQDTSFPWFEGTTLSSIASSAQGAAAHELGHAFGLGHDFRNDANFDGNLMGNGLRGWRGARYPDFFPSDDTQLSYGAALALSVSRYFNPDAVYTDDIKPTLNVATSGAVNPSNGQLQVHFSGSDSSGLAAALLRRNGDLVAETRLSGISLADAVISTPYFVAGQNDQYTLDLYDAQGNKQSANVNITVNGGFNCAPQPFLDLWTSIANRGQNVLLDASWTIDPDDSTASLMYSWDLNSDGIFEVGPSSSSTLTTSFSSAGDRLIYVRVTDPHGAISVSEPLSLRIVPEPGINWNGGYSSDPTNWGVPQNWSPNGIPDGPGTQVIFGNQSPGNNVVDMISVGRTVGSINFAASTSTTIQSTGGYHLTLDNDGSASSITLEGSHTISAPLILNNDASITGSGDLRLSGGVTGNYALSVSSIVTTNSIQISALTISSGAKLIIAPGDAGGMAAVPEPSTLLLLGAGAFSLLACARRRLIV
jgi:hypothetical protein